MKNIYFTKFISKSSFNNNKIYEKKIIKFFEALFSPSFHDYCNNSVGIYVPYNQIKYTQRKREKKK